MPGRRCLLPPGLFSPRRQRGGGAAAALAPLLLEAPLDACPAAGGTRGRRGGQGAEADTQVRRDNTGDGTEHRGPGEGLRGGFAPGPAAEPGALRTPRACSSCLQSVKWVQHSVGFPLRSAACGGRNPTGAFPPAAEVLRRSGSCCGGRGRAGQGRHPRWARGPSPQPVGE